MSEEVAIKEEYHEFVDAYEKYYPKAGEVFYSEHENKFSLTCNNCTMKNFTSLEKFAKHYLACNEFLASDNSRSYDVCRDEIESVMTEPLYETENAQNSIITQPLLTNEQKLISLLEKFNCKEILQFLKDGNVVYKHLPYLLESDLSELLPKNQIGLKAMFRTKLFDWQKTKPNCEEENDIISNMELNQTLKVKPIINTSFNESINKIFNTNERIKPKTFKRKRTSLSPVDPAISGSSKGRQFWSVLEMLQASTTGQTILQYYERHGNTLSEEMKNEMLNIIVRNFLDPVTGTCIYRPTPSDVDRMSTEISELFECEDKDVYYIPRCSASGRKNPSGRLFHRFVNNIRGKVGNKPLTLATPIKTIETEKSIQLTQLEMMELNRLKEKLNQSSTLNEIDAIWDKTFKIRRKLVQENKGDLEKILSEWSLFKQDNGYIYIKKDFTTLHPSKSLNLLNEWETFTSKMMMYYSDGKVKDKQLSELFKICCTTNINKESKDCIIALLLNGVLKPVISILTDPETGKPKSVRATIKESINSFMVLAENSEDIERIMETRPSEKPFIIAVGPTYEETSEFHIKFKNLTYIFSSFATALDLCFKCFHIFEIDYPTECFAIWKFIDIFFFQLPSILPDKKNPALVELLGYLKR